MYPFVRWRDQRDIRAKIINQFSQLKDPILYVDFKRTYTLNKGLELYALLTESDSTDRQLAGIYNLRRYTIDRFIISGAPEIHAICYTWPIPRDEKKSYFIKYVPSNDFVSDDGIKHMYYHIPKNEKFFSDMAHVLHYEPKLGPDKDEMGCTRTHEIIMSEIVYEFEFRDSDAVYGLHIVDGYYMWLEVHFASEKEAMKFTMQNAIVPFINEEVTKDSEFFLINFWVKTRVEPYKKAPRVEALEMKLDILCHHPYKNMKFNW